MKHGNQGSIRALEAPSYLTHGTSFNDTGFPGAPLFLCVVLLLLHPSLITPFHAPRRHRAPSPSSGPRFPVHPRAVLSSFSSARYLPHPLCSVTDQASSSSSSSSNSNRVQRNELENLTIYELRNACRERGLTVATRARRNEMIEMLRGQVGREGGREGGE